MPNPTAVRQIRPAVIASSPLRREDRTAYPSIGAASAFPYDNYRDALRKPARFEFDGGRRRCTEFRATEAAERDGPGGAYVLPRQAGTEDAPDVTFRITPVVDAQQERTDRWISEQTSPGPVHGGRRR